MMTRLVVLLLSLFSYMASALAADVQHGRQLAFQLCARCHQISPEQPRRATAAPPFADIPRRTALDEVRLGFYLLIEKNKQMIGRNISLGEATDLAAYIMSVKR